jgi:hypothetical protein
MLSFTLGLSISLAVLPKAIAALPRAAKALSDSLG